MRNRPRRRQMKSRRYGKDLQRKTSPAEVIPLAERTVEGYSGFFRDTKLNLNFRTYYFYRDKFDDTVSESWALAGLSRTSLAGFLITSAWAACSIRPRDFTDRTIGMGHCC